MERKFYRDPETGEVFEFEADGSQDEYIPENLVRMTHEEVEEHLNPPEDPVHREDLWKSQELEVVKDNLEAILFEDPEALPGTEAEWKSYGLALRKWKEGAEGYPSVDNRPQRP